MATLHERGSDEVVGLFLYSPRLTDTGEALPADDELNWPDVCAPQTDE